MVPCAVISLSLRMAGKDDEWFYDFIWKDDDKQTATANQHYTKKGMLIYVSQLMIASFRRT